MAQLPDPASGHPVAGQPGGLPGSPPRTGRLLVVVVAGVEALIAAAGAATALLSGVRGGSLVLAAAVAGVAGGIAYLLLAAARGFATGKRWPTGIFVTAQLLVALVALSLGGRALLTFADNPRIGAATVAALALAVAGLVGVTRIARARSADPAGSRAEEPPPVF